MAEDKGKDPEKIKIPEQRNKEKFFSLLEDPLSSFNKEEIPLSPAWEDSIFNLSQKIFSSKEENLKEFKIPFYIPYWKKEEENESTFFGIKPLHEEKLKKEKSKVYTPRVEDVRRRDAGFYPTFYAHDIVGVVADYDDLLASFFAKHPKAKLQFDPKSGNITTNEGEPDLAELKSFIHDVADFGVPFPVFDPEGSARRIEERAFFQAIRDIELNSRITTLFDLQRTGLLAKAVPNFTRTEVQMNCLTDKNKGALRKFFGRRQLFWHPDTWSHADGLTKDQKDRITKMSAKLNRLAAYL